MKIVVCIKHVPARDSRLRIAQSGEWIEERDLSWEINEPDTYALEEALRLREKHGGEVLAITAGPDRAAEALKRGLAMGADRAIHLAGDVFNAADANATARGLADALRGEAPDLVLAGVQSDDKGYAATGVMLAELLGMPHSTLIMEVEVLDGRVKVKREMESGWFEWLELPLPAVLTIQSGINQVRYSTLKGIMAAKKKDLRRVEAPAAGSAGTGPAGTGPAGTSPTALHGLAFPSRTSRAEIFDGDGKAAAGSLWERLRRDGKLR
ncbi:MAG: electron transfer flavoprotein subunit beta/FixA family protein [Gemmatimonadetes bacterium]|nr:electron transfer flavoprotein subunit beta/FixA family protein [Gemmatimonadota bacterium]